jgi:hypothetical protein
MLAARKINLIDSSRLLVRLYLAVAHPEFRGDGATIASTIRLECGADQAVERQEEGLSLPWLQTSLGGRWRGNRHPGELGAALRKLGFTRHRQWRGATGFRAVWRKPG